MSTRLTIPSATLVRQAPSPVAVPATLGELVDSLAAQGVRHGSMKTLSDLRAAFSYWRKQGITHVTVARARPRPEMPNEHLLNLAVLGLWNVALDARTLLLSRPQNHHGGLDYAFPVAVAIGAAPEAVDALVNALARKVQWETLRDSVVMTLDLSTDDPRIAVSFGDLTAIEGQSRSVLES